MTEEISKFSRVPTRAAGMRELRGCGLLVGRPDRRGTTLPTVDRRDHERRVEIARHIWIAGIPARGTPVTQYLAGRGIIIEPPPASATLISRPPRQWRRLVDPEAAAGRWKLLESAGRA